MNGTRISVLVFGLAVGVFAQTGGSQSSSSPTTGGAGQLHKENNAASATQDTSAISGDQVTKPGGAKTTTVIGCLGGQGANGHFVLNSMQYRSGIEVLGPTNLQAAAGQKVKLTGSWAPSATASEGDKRQASRFQATSFDVLAEKCPPPADTTPVSKKKQKQQKAAAKQNSASNPQ